MPRGRNVACSRGPADLRRGDLPRRVALSGDRPVGRAARRADRVPPALPRGRAGQLPAHEFADPANTFHEKAILCRAAENTCYFATVNCASEGSPTTSAVARPDGTLLAYQPYGQAGLLVADIDLSSATGLLASRLKE